ncbi:MAG: SoxR reducing system RseC family protein [Candidatus Omnitrophica bacterium]|nr:SoxR reducing system RseC family protein [Candidatus Omnitrophota bacterium]
MFKETVEVIDVNGTEISIKFQRHSACGCCRAKVVCGIDQRHPIIVKNNSFALSVGDTIVVGIEERKTLQATAISFIFPAIIFMVTLLFFKNVGELISFLLAISILFVYYLIVKVLIKKKAEHFSLKIIKKI